MNEIKWVSDLISEDDIKSWNDNSIVTITAGTGMGKSYFIKNNLYEYARANAKTILLLVHRINCLEQFKMHIEGKEDIITLETYQTLDYMYEKDLTFDFSIYDYIVCDEFHYFTSDSAFNNTTDMSIKAILEQKDSIKIFMSATGDLMQEYMKDKKLETIDYKLKTNYDFIDRLYFYSRKQTEENLIEDIINKNEKAIVFINNLKRLEELYLKYKEYSLFNCAENNKQYKYVCEDTITTMLEDKRFDKNILFTTSVLDTGVSIKDADLKHIIINNVADLDLIEQMVGRKRIIDENDKINVYIKDINNNVLGAYITQASNRLNRARYLIENGQINYIKKYKKKAENKSIVYFTIVDDNIQVKINDMAYWKTRADIALYQQMIDKGYKQLVSDTFNMNHVTIIEQKMHECNLIEYLDNIVGDVMLIMKDREDLIDKINVRQNGRLLKSLESLNSALREQNINFYIDKFSTSRMINGKKKNYNSAWRVLRLSDK